MALTKTISARLVQTAAFTYTATDAAGVNFQGTPGIGVTTNLSTSAVTKFYSAVVTGGTPVTLDLESCVDEFGATITFASVSAVVIQNQATNHALVVGGGSNSLLGADQYTLSAGTPLILTSGWTVTGGAYNIVVTPAASLTYAIYVVGN